jgi:replication factor A3
MDKPTPRINSELREKYVGRTVRLTGHVVSVSFIIDNYSS